MAVGLSAPSTLHPIEGIRIGSCAAGLRYPNRRDLVVVEIAPGTEVAAAFTRNRFCAAPIQVAHEHLQRSRPRAFMINTGYANAGLGAVGLEDARACCNALAAVLGCTPEQVLPFSTGVVGERLPVDRLTAALPRCVAALDASGWLHAAQGIMTTDTVAKGVSKRITMGEHTITVTGIAKGAGMIRPDMATMLAFVATDAAITQEALQTCIAHAVTHSFNRITVDGDTSTNDACVLLATHRAGVRIGEDNDAALAQLAEAFTDVCVELAQAIVRDAEGATKFITIEVVGGESDRDCLEIAYTVAHSPLVKTAFFASDPNWGRILAAVGRSNVDKLDVSALSICLDDVRVVNQGAVDPQYTETKGQAVMRKPEITVRVDLGSGPSSVRIWTADLSHDYVRINAEYRS